MVEPSRFEALPPMLCVGIRRVHAYADAADGIRRQWDEFAALGAIAGSTGDALYGIMCGADDGGFEYMCGAEVADFAHAPSGLGRIRIPAQQYAVFPVSVAARLAETWFAIWHDWIPGSGYEIAHTPEFERYPDGLPNGRGAGRIEIYASIRENGA